MKKILFLATIVCGLTASAAQAQVVLIDQIGVNPALLNGASVYASQRFSDFPTFDIGTGDNFTVPAGGSVALTSVQVVTGGFSGFTAAHYTDGILTQWAIEIYSSTAAATANLTGDVSHTVLAFNDARVSSAAFATDPQRLVTFNFAGLGVNLAPGNYHLAVIASMPFGTGGEIGPISSGTFAGTPHDSNAWQANPAGGFGLPGNFQFVNPASDAAYRILAAPVPEPTSMALVGIGAIGFGWRRWKKR